MGSESSKIDLAPNLKDITIINESYKLTNFSEKDIYEKSIANKLMPLFKINLGFFAYFLRKFKDNEKSQNFTKKINEKIKTDFKEFINDLFVCLEKYFKLYTKDDKRNLTKLHVLSFALLFCEGKSIEKIKLFFDVLSNKIQSKNDGDDKKKKKHNNNDNNEYKLTYNKEYKEFLFCLFSLGSYVLFEVSKNRKYITEEEEQYLTNDSYLNYTSVITLLLMYKSKVLENKKEYLFEEFVELFNKNDISNINWPFDISGILILLINYCNIKDKIYNNYN
jgi:hypothetical protein